MRRDRGAARSPLQSVLLGALGLLATACVSGSVGVVGETPLPPASEIPIVTLAVVDDEGVPVANARVRVEADDVSTQTDVAGMAMIEWRGRPVSVSVNATGFFPGAVAVEEFQDGALELSLRPVVLRGQVTDSSGFGLGGTTVSLNGEEVVTDANGRFELKRAQQGQIDASRPGWHATTQDWDGEALVTTVTLTPRIIRGLHIGSNIFADEAEWEKMLEVANDTVVNAFVIDIKDESGRVYHNSAVSVAREVGAVRPLFDLEDVVADMDEADLYKIARIVLFQDPVAARALPEIAVLNEEGTPYNKRGQFFLDPSDPAARAYGLALAEEVCAAGVDEIQFDYVRYPDGFPDTAVFDLVPTEETRVAQISSFLDEASDRLHPLGCAVAADVFGFVTSINYDGGIGQNFATLSDSVDVLSPMIYPSHYSTGWFGYDVPNDNPGGVVGGALDDGVTRLQGPAIVRPWLQDFYYTADQVREQIDEAESRALGWMLWNALSNFQLDALADEPATTTTAP